MGLTQSFAGLLVVRFFLGVAESGFFPGAAFYLSMWYKRNEQHYRIALLTSSVALAGAFGGLMVSYPPAPSSTYLKGIQAFGLAKMRGIAGLGGWRWIFIIVNLSAPVFDVMVKRQHAILGGSTHRRLLHCRILFHL
jgi:MFS family permease